MHSLWSDGDQYPEMIVDWYKSHGYDFLAMSDHNTLQEGERWTNTESNKAGAEGLKGYIKRFGTNWVEQRGANGAPQRKRWNVKKSRSFSFLTTSI